ncbi:MAG: MotA/TolQ/ExbB proton channel family protein [Spirulina sp. SIO3F2]|nr:MotA/TolQ/ExbB proton channel family protein [Spirulina sp. SIO3F2]
MAQSSLLAAGGVVMLPLLMLSMITVVLVGERLWFWWRVSRQQKRLVVRFFAQYGEEPDAAIAQLEAYPHLPIARIFLTALNPRPTSPATLRLALETAAQQELPLLKRFNTVFTTVIAVSPLFGLLGTLLGLMRVFVNLDLSSPSGLQNSGITRGIAEALISTATGLAIAILTLIFTNFFLGLYHRQRSFLQVTGGQLELLYRQQYPQAE